MYSVSDGYRQAIRQRVVCDRIAGTIVLADGTVLALSDKNVVKNSLRISHELCGDYRIGTFHIGCLRISVFDDNALLHDFSGAEIAPVYQIRTESGWESVPMGIYLADGNSIGRKRNTVSFTAYDYGCLFDRAIPEERRSLTGNARALIEAACEDCGVVLGGIPAGLPNECVTARAGDAQIQTYRDLIAWCADLLCGYAVIDREGKLRIRSAKYGVSGTDSTEIQIDKYLSAEERDSISVTDTRAYIRTVYGYREGVLKAYVSEIDQPDEQAAPAGYTFAENPLLTKMLTPEEQDRVNADRLAFMDGFKQRGIRAEIYGDPALDAGDVLRCSEGDIDQRRSIVGLVTKQEWRYRNFHTVICAAPPLLGQSTQPTAAVRNQTDKKLDGLSARTKLTAGAGVEIQSDTISLKPAQYSMIGDPYLEDKLGGVAIYQNEGLVVNYNGLLRLDWANHGHFGGVVLGAGIAREDGRISVNIGPGMQFNLPPEDQPQNNLAEYSVSPKLGKNLSFGENGEINAAGTELKAGENIAISDGGVISAIVREYKAGDNIEISEDGTISANTADGAELTAGGGIAIETDAETGKRTVSAAVGEGAEIRDGKICTVPNIQTGILITEKDAKYLLHHFTETEYIAGNQIGYAGPGNQIVVRGRIAYSAGVLGGGSSGSLYYYTEATYNQYLADKSRYAGFSDFPFYSTAARRSFTGISMDLVQATGAVMKYGVSFVKEDGTMMGVHTIEHRTARPAPGIVLTYNTVYAPGSTVNGIVYENGAVNCTLWMAGAPALRGDYYIRQPLYSGTCDIPFASPAEYQAAVGLTYEPLTLTEVTDSPTIVSASETEGK